MYVHVLWRQVENDPAIRESIQNGWHRGTLDIGIHGGKKKKPESKKDNKENGT
jgi:hypothetical protein